LANEIKRNQFIDELAVFYLTQDIKLNNSKQYRAIGMMLLEKYESLRTDINQACDFQNRVKMYDAASKKKLVQPWVSLVKFQYK
jgi:hypothetical protein